VGVRWGSGEGQVRAGEGHVKYLSEGLSWGAQLGGSGERQLRDSDEGQGRGRGEADEGRVRNRWESQVRDSGSGQVRGR
jgi:hypothetical protein